MEDLAPCTRVRRCIAEAIGEHRSTATIYADARQDGRRFKPYTFWGQQAAARKAMEKAVDLLRAEGDLTLVDYGLVTRQPHNSDASFTFHIVVKEAL